jgi:hypothetical protein
MGLEAVGRQGNQAARRTFRVGAPTPLRLERAAAPE